MNIIEETHITTLYCPYCKGKALYIPHLLTERAIAREKRRHQFCSFIHAMVTGERRFLFIVLLIICASVAGVYLCELTAYFFFGTSL